MRICFFAITFAITLSIILPLEAMDGDDQMEKVCAATVLIDEEMLVRMWHLNQESKIRFFRKLVKKRITYNVSLEYEIACLGQSNYPAPLYYASSSDKMLSITKKLLRHGANPNVVSKTWVLTPLCNALEYGETEKTVKVLLRAGADPNFKSPAFGSTPLHMACLNVFRCYSRNNRSTQAEKAYLKYIRMLLRSGADPNMKDSKGNTPLFELISLPKEGMKIVAQLLLFDADIKVKNNKDQDIFEYAKVKPYRPAFNTVNYLKDWQAGNIKLRKKKIK